MKLIHIADVHWGAMPDRDQPWGKERAKEIKEKRTKRKEQQGDYLRGKMKVQKLMNVSEFE